MNPKIKNYVIPAIPILLFIFSPFWNNYLHEDNSRMTFSYWLHWFIIYGGGGLILFALGYCFWGGIQLRINRVKNKYNKEIEILLCNIDAARKEIEQHKKNIEELKKHHDGRIRELTDRYQDKMDKLRNEKELLRKENTELKEIINNESRPQT